MFIFLVSIAAAILIYLLFLRCRRGHPGLNAFRNYAYAHRGLHGNGVPENSMEAFRLALQSGYGIELDIHLLKDGGLGIMHDSNMKRMTGADRQIEDLTTAELKQYHLNGTDQTIPDFHDVLDLFDGKAPLILELKSANNNYKELTEAVCQLMDSYHGPYCMESFDTRCVYWMKKYRPQVIRGQLSQNFIPKNGSKVPFVLRFIATTMVSNFLTVPDFVAYRYIDRGRLGNKICRTIWGAQSVSWTLKSQEEFDNAVKEGCLPIFEGFRPQKVESAEETLS